MITFDANVLIARFNPSDPSHERAVDVIDHHEWDEFATSAVTLAEALVRPARDLRLAECQAFIDELHVWIMPVEEHDAADIATLCAEHKLKTPDAVALHTALRRSDALVTFDRKLARAARVIGFPVIENAPAELEHWELAGPSD